MNKNICCSKFSTYVIYLWMPTVWSNFIFHKKKFFSNSTTCPCGLVDFVILPPGHGRSVTDFWGWEAHEAQLRSPDDLSGDIGRCSARRPLNLNSTNLPRQWSPRESSPSGKIPTVEPGIEPGTSWLVVKRLWPLDHEADHFPQNA